MKAVWNGTVIAESDDTYELEGNQYFPVDSLKKEFFQDSALKTSCPWKGEAHYYDVVVGDEVNRDAAWTYPEPKEAAEEIRDRIAFWRGVQVDG